MNPRRAVIASRLYEPEAAAAAARLGNLARALERAGMEVRVYSTRSPGARRSTEQVRRWPVLRDRSGAVRGYLQYASFDVPLFFRLLLARRPDVIVAEPPPTTGFVVRAVARLRRIPYVYYSADVTSAALSAVKVNRLVKRVLVRVERGVLRGAAAVLAISEGVRDELLRLGTDPDRITIVGTGVDTDLFQPDGATPHAAGPSLVYAGTMSEFQGADVFVRAFQRVVPDHPQAVLRLFGGGVDLPRLRGLGAELPPGRLEFHGTVPPSEAAGWLRGAAAGLASIRPGRGYDFAFPTKALASAACGTPVIFAGVGPLRDIIEEHGLGWSVDWDVDAVANAMKAALDRPRRLEPEAREWLRNRYSLRAVADRAAAAVKAVAR